MPDDDKAPQSPSKILATAIDYDNGCPCPLQIAADVEERTIFVL